MERIKVDDNGCWIWQGALSSGYGAIGGSWWGDEKYAHRWAYRSFTGPIPDGYEIDHLCRVQACCNPAHLEAVTPRVNKQRAVSHWHADPVRHARWLANVTAAARRRAAA